jgi:hypothetical protein
MLSIVMLSGSSNISVPASYKLVDIVGSNRACYNQENLFALSIKRQINITMCYSQLLNTLFRRENFITLLRYFFLSTMRDIPIFNDFLLVASKYFSNMTFHSHSTDIKTFSDIHSVTSSVPNNPNSQAHVIQYDVLHFTLVRLAL